MKFSFGKNLNQLCLGANKLLLNPLPLFNHRITVHFLSLFLHFFLYFFNRLLGVADFYSAPDTDISNLKASTGKIILLDFD